MLEFIVSGDLIRLIKIVIMLKSPLRRLSADRDYPTKTQLRALAVREIREHLRYR